MACCHAASTHCYDSSSALKQSNTPWLEGTLRDTCKKVGHVVKYFVLGRSMYSFLRFRLLDFLYITDYKYCIPSLQTLRHKHTHTYIHTRRHISTLHTHYNTNYNDSIPPLITLQVRDTHKHTPAYMPAQMSPHKLQYKLQ